MEHLFEQPAQLSSSAEHRSAIVESAPVCRQDVDRLAAELSRRARGRRKAGLQGAAVSGAVLLAIIGTVKLLTLRDRWVELVVQPLAILLLILLATAVPI